MVFVLASQHLELNMSKMSQNGCNIEQQDAQEMCTVTKQQFVDALKRWPYAGAKCFFKGIHKNATHLNALRRRHIAEMKNHLKMPERLFQYWLTCCVYLADIILENNPFREFYGQIEEIHRSREATSSAEPVRRLTTDQANRLFRRTRINPNRSQSSVWERPTIECDERLTLDSDEQQGLDNNLNTLPALAEVWENEQTEELLLDDYDQDDSINSPPQKLLPSVTAKRVDSPVIIVLRDECDWTKPILEDDAIFSSIVDNESEDDPYQWSFVANNIKFQMPLSGSDLQHLEELVKNSPAIRNKWKNAIIKEYGRRVLNHVFEDIIDSEERNYKMDHLELVKVIKETIPGSREQVEESWKRMIQLLRQRINKRNRRRNKRTNKNFSC